MKKTYLLALLLLLTSLPLQAAPTAQEARELVDRIISWSLVPVGAQMGAADWETVSQHKADFSTAFFEHMEWASRRHKDAEGVEVWMYTVAPIWQTQASAVTKIAVGSAKAEGDHQLVVVDYVSPSGISPERPSTKYHCVWVIGESQGRAVLEDIRYHIKYPVGPRQGRVLDDLKKAKAEAP